MTEQPDFKHQADDTTAAAVHPPLGANISKAPHQVLFEAKTHQMHGRSGAGHILA